MTYIGHVEGAAGSSATVVVIGSAISGTIRIPGRFLYVLATDQTGRHVIRAVDPSKLPPDHPRDYGSRQGKGPSEPTPVRDVGDTCTTDDPTRITVMILYTSQAQRDAGGKDAVEAAIYAAIAEANQAYVNSDINMQLGLVHVAGPLTLPLGAPSPTSAGCTTRAMAFWTTPKACGTLIELTSSV